MHAARLEVLRGGTPVGDWPLPMPERLDMGVVDTLARCQLAARRIGLSIHLVEPPPELVELIELAGLGDVLLWD